MLTKFIGELLEFIAIVWLVRFVLNNLLGGVSRRVPPSQAASNAPSQPPPAEKIGEMKKDPQCGTYVSTELSIKVRHRGDLLHFCSPQCQQAYLEAHSSKPA